MIPFIVRFLFFFITNIIIVIIGEEKKNQIAFVIPIHEPKFNYLNDFFQSLIYHKLNTDCIYVFSNSNDYNKWNEFSNKKYTNSKNLIPIIFTDYSNGTEIKGSPIFNKKLLPITIFGKIYSYFILIDAEVKVIKSVDVLQLANSYFDKKTLYCSNIPNSELVSRVSMRHFSEDDQLKLKKINNNNLCYFWFNDIPFVESKTALQFLSFISYSPLKEYAWTEFECLGIIVVIFIPVYRSFLIILMKLNCIISLSYIYTFIIIFINTLIII